MDQRKNRTRSPPRYYSKAQKQQSPQKDPKANLQEFREIFRLVDTDDSGDISREELFQIMKQIGLKPTMAQVSTMLAEVDQDESGTIDFDEFVAVMTGHTSSQSYSLEQILQAFRIFDKESKGYITIEEMEHILTKCGDDSLSVEEAKKLITTLDHDKKGKIYYEKYCNIYSS